MSEQAANLCTADACESLRARLAKYEDAEGRPVAVLPDHERAKLVNALRDCATTYAGTDQLRAQIATVLGQFIPLNSSPVSAGGVDERATFEARFPLHDMSKRQDDDGDVVYLDDWTQGAFIGWQARSALPAPESVGGVDVVEVVGVRITTDCFGSYIADSAMGVPAAMPGEVREPLMTISQHQRILAASAHPADQVAFEALQHAVAYLSRSPMEAIHAGSALHRLMAQALAKP